MKHVFSNDMVAHVWAQRSQPSGYTSNRNFSFDGAVLISYSTPIAAFVPGTRKRTACLISERSYSVSTARHISLARRAVHGVPVFIVPHVMNDKWSRQPMQVKENKKQHRENLASLVAEYVGMVGKFRRMRDYHGTEVTMAGYLGNLADNAFRYAEMFGLKRPKLTPDTDASTIWAYRAERETRFATPEHQAKLERSRVRREERKAEAEEKRRQQNYADALSRFVRYMMDEDGTHFWHNVHASDFPADSIERRYLLSAEHARNMEAGRAWKATFDAWMSGSAPMPTERNTHAVLSIDEDAAWQAAKDAAAVAKRADQIAAWRAGGHAYQVYDVPTMLRVKTLNTGDMYIQTSKGAEFPLAHALRAIPLVLRCVQTQTEWKRNGHTVHLGSFQIDHVDASGTVTAGCHRVAFTEIARLIVTLRELGHLSGECDCGGLEAHTYSCSFNRPAVLEASTDETL